MQNDLFQDIDLDANFYSDNYRGFSHGLTSDAYYDTNTFNEAFGSNSDKDLKIIHLNVRSLPRNGDSLVAYLDLLDQKFHVICLTETWLNENRLLENNFPDYVQYHSMRPIDHPPGGGSAVLVRRDFESKELIDLSCNSNHIECVFVKISVPSGDLIVASCYRRPENSISQSFITELSAKISNLNPNCKKFIAGDFNFNLLRIENDMNASAFLDAMLSLGLIHTISKPTRNVNTSISLLDNIFLSNSLGYHSGLLYWDISDHYPIFAFIKNVFSVSNETGYVKFRILNETTIENLRYSVANLDFTDIMRSDDLNLSIEKLDEILLSQYNQHCPILSKKITMKDKEKPWLNNNFLKSLIRNRQNRYKLYKRNRITHEEHKIYRNYVNKQITEAKKKYFSNLLKEVRHNMKRVWTVLNGLLKPGIKRNGKQVESLVDNGTVLSNDEEISNCLNKHFSEIGMKISNEFDDVDHHITSTNSIPNSLFFRETHPEDILKIIDGMKNKSCNINSYPVKVIKELKLTLSPIISELINKSLTTGYFPDTFKIARVIPLHKGDSKEVVNNYRPISILPIVSKIFERAVYNQLYSFLEKFKLLTSNQFGFRKNKSTVQAILDQLEYVYNELDQSHTVISIFMDFSKAFDCIDHQILLEKLKFNGVRGIALQWFESYLSGRSQFVCVNNTTSRILPIKYGVPQGSILGPLLFLIFINDFPNVNPFFKFCLFADDSTLTCSFNTSNESFIKQRLENELVSVHNWLKMNKIKINYSKSKFMIFSYGKKHAPFNIKFGTNVITSTDSIKFLGIMVDQHLNFKSHISYVSSKLSKAVGLLFRLNNILPFETMTTLYSTLFLPHVLYGVEVWFGVLQSNNDRIFKLQKKAIRAINCLPYNSHTNDSFKSMKLLKLEDIYKLRVLTYMFKSDNFAVQSENHSYSTRYRNNLTIPRFNRSKTQSTIFYNGILLWNTIPDDIRSVESVGAFKARIKDMLLGEY